MLTDRDYIDIHRLFALYGHCVDERQFSRLPEIFTEDTHYDMTTRGFGLHIGIPALRKLWTEAGDNHPLAHHLTNVLVDETPEGADIAAKGVCVHPQGTVHSTTYRGRAVRTPEGWRISYLHAEKRSPEAIPAIS